MMRLSQSQTKCATLNMYMFLLLPETGAWHVLPQPFEQHFSSPGQLLSFEQASTHVPTFPATTGHTPGFPSK